MHYDQDGVICPRCNHAFTVDDMHRSGVDLWALAPREDWEEIDCPACHQEFWVQGSYKPVYTTAVTEEELLG